MATTASLSFSLFTHSVEPRGAITTSRSGSESALPLMLIWCGVLKQMFVKAASPCRMTNDGRRAKCISDTTLWHVFLLAAILHISRHGTSFKSALPACEACDFPRLSFWRLYQHHLSVARASEAASEPVSPAATVAVAKRNWGL